MKNSKEKKLKKRTTVRYRVIPLERADFMGIDWGESDIGIALADSETKVAYAQLTLHNGSGLLETIGDIIRKKEVKTVVIGIPSPINRDEVEYAGEQLGKILKQNFGVDVKYENEMFTTKIAQRRLIERGIRSIDRYDDQEAARIILQDFLDREIKKKRDKEKENTI